MKKVFSFLFIFSALFGISQSPSFQWAKQIGHTSSNDGFSIVTDTYGNTITIGFFDGIVDFDPGDGVYNLNSANGGLFILTLHADGKFLRAEQLTAGTCLASGPDGTIYIGGIFAGTADFDPGPGIVNLNSTAGSVFILKLDKSGNLIWAKQMKPDHTIVETATDHVIGVVLELVRDHGVSRDLV